MLTLAFKITEICICIFSRQQIIYTKLVSIVYIKTAYVAYGLKLKMREKGRGDFYTIL